MARTRVVEETWSDVEKRLGHALDELERMLRHLSSRPAAPLRRKRERELRRWLRGAIDWIDVLFELGGPRDEEEGLEVVLELYHFDLERVQAVDRFQELLEEAGEPLPPT
ncbi:MAG: hypothetical protein ACYDCL_10205 [Myxococcales bacterium]